MDSDGDGVGSLLDEVGFQRASATNRCPQCKEDMVAEAVLCVNCGYHLETGKTLETLVVQKKEKTVSSVAPSAKPSAKQAADMEKLASARKFASIGLGLFTLNMFIAVAIGAYVGFEGFSQIGGENLNGEANSGKWIIMVFPAIQLIGLAAYVLMVIGIFRLANQMNGQTTAIVLMVIALIPCTTIFILLWAYSKSGGILKKAGMN